jgi:chemotaxis protein methyltransferase CheR
MGLAWAGYRKVRGTVRRRLGRRLAELGLASVDVYETYLETHAPEWLELESLCRIPISRFWRDRLVFELLGSDILPACAQAARSQGGRQVRCLSAGCASGEEPYSVRLVWEFRVAPAHPRLSLEIVALDADDRMLERARRGRYKASSLKEVPADMRGAAFAKENGTWRLHDAFRRGVSFMTADLKREVPAGRFDLVLCRNAGFTYFDDEERAALFARLDEVLRNGGFLVIGVHEILPPGGAAYEPHGRRSLIFRKPILASPS